MRLERTHWRGVLQTGDASCKLEVWCEYHQKGQGAEDNGRELLFGAAVSGYAAPGVLGAYAGRVRKGSAMFSEFQWEIC